MSNQQSIDSTFTESSLNRQGLIKTVLDASGSDLADTLYAPDTQTLLDEAFFRSTHVQQADEQAAEPQQAFSLSFGPSIFSKLALNPRSTDSSAERERFEVTSRLGSGAFGDVFGAQDHDLNRRVALKQFKGESNQALASCHNELRFVGRLEHPSVPPVYQASLTQEGTPYIVMKQLEGESLEHIISKLQAGDPQTHAQYPFYKRIELVIQLLRVVSNAHQSKVLHRDIKPENVMIGQYGELYLMDWGIAEDFEQAQKNPILCGTPFYMSPEQAQAMPLQPASDVYSIGVLAYELMCLKRPTPDVKSLRELIEVLPTHKAKRIDWVFHASQGYISSEFVMPIMKALEPQVSERYHSATAMLDELEIALKGEFKVVCPRTHIKSLSIRLNKWLDQKLKNILILYIMVLSAIALLIGFGILMGSMLSH